MAHQVSWDDCKELHTWLNEGDAAVELDFTVQWDHTTQQWTVRYEEFGEGWGQHITVEGHGTTLKEALDDAQTKF